MNQLRLRRRGDRNPSDRNTETLLSELEKLEGKGGKF